MALQKTVTDVHGNNGNYWPIRNFNVQARDAETVVEMVLFKDKATADANKTRGANTKEMLGQTVRVKDDADLRAAIEAMMGLLYAKIKLVDTGIDFTDADDVLE